MVARKYRADSRGHDPEAARAIGQGLRAWRDRRDLTQVGAAGLLGANVSTLRKWENGETIPRASIARALVLEHGAIPAEALGLPDGGGQGDGA